MFCYHFGNFLLVAVDLSAPLHTELSNGGRVVDCEDEGCFSSRLVFLVESDYVDVHSNLDLGRKLSFVTPVPLARQVSNLDYDP